MFPVTKQSTLAVPRSTKSEPSLHTIPGYG